MDLAGLTPPDFVQGNSLKNLLMNNDFISEKRSALSELRINLNSKVAQGYSIRTDRFRFTKWS